MIDQKLRGQPIYAKGSENSQAIQQNLILGQLGDHLKSRDVDLKSATNAEIKKLLQEEAAAPAIDPLTGSVLHQGRMERAGDGTVSFAQADIPGEPRIRLTGNEVGHFDGQSIDQARADGPAYYKRELQGTAPIEREGLLFALPVRRSEGSSTQRTERRFDYWRLFPTSSAT